MADFWWWCTPLRVAVWSDAELRRDAIPFRPLMVLHVANGLSDGSCKVPTQKSHLD